MSNTEALRAALAQALAALATCNSNDGDDPWFDHEKVYAAREAARAALAAKPAASGEPVAFYKDADAEPPYAQFARGVAEGFALGIREGKLQAANDATPHPAPAPRPKWMEAPRRTEWGAGMMESLIALGTDETLRLYAHRDVVPMADALLSAHPAPARVPLTDAEIAELHCETDSVGVRFLQPSTFRVIARAIEAAHGITAKEAP